MLFLTMKALFLLLKLFLGSVVLFCLLICIIFIKILRFLNKFSWSMRIFKKLLLFKKVLVIWIKKKMRNNNNNNNNDIILM
jgi:hypothetical protein